jgi:hypothetical protein
MTEPSMSEPVERFLARLDHVVRRGEGWSAQCPAHPDADPSLSIGEADDGSVLTHCFAGCTREAILAALGLHERDLHPPRPGGRRRRLGAGAAGGHGRSGTRGGDDGGLTLAALAAAKKIPLEFLTRLGCSDAPGPSVRIPYHDADGNVVAVRYRMALAGARFRWRKGDHVVPYGLERLGDARAAGWLLLGEGESDCWTAWSRGLPALGIPGKATWQPAWASDVADIPEIYLWQEPDAEDLVERVARDLPDVRVIVAPPGIKDVSVAHVRGDDVVALLERLKAGARPAQELLRERADRRRREMYAAAASVLASPDPLALVEAEIHSQGYGGDLGAPMLGYLAATSRILKSRRGSMPAHALFKGPSSSGKNAALRAVLDLLPAEAYHVIDAGSSRVLIYDDAELVHRVVVFSEADSLPAGEDNPAASAVRNLLQDGCLHYKVVERHPATGQQHVRTIVKPGPSVLLTTSTHSLGEQLMTRLFIIEVPDDPDQLQAALAAQAALELDDPLPASEALIAFQAYLQASGPFDVVVPFAKELSAHLGRWSKEPRILRDFPRLLSLIKAAAVLRVAHRVRDSRGRLVATLDDYAAVRSLVADAYQASTGASARIRDAVAAVRNLTTGNRGGSTATVTEVANMLGVSVASATRRVRDAIAGGWLINEEVRRSQKARLRVGEPLPPISLLPTPDELLAEVPPLDLGSSADLAGAAAAQTDQHRGVHPPVNPEIVKTVRAPITHEPPGVFTISPDTDGSDDWIEVEPPEHEPPTQPSLWNAP